MSYTVYVSNHCSSCERVTKFLKEHKIPCKIVNINTDSNHPLMNVYIICPALFSEGKLLAYGDDIIQKLKKPDVIF